MPTTTKYAWPTPANTDYVKDGAQAMRNLGDAIDTSMTVTANALVKGDANGKISGLANGTDGYVLTMSGGAPTWMQASSGTYDWTLISSSTPTSGTTVTFGSIPSYKNLRLVVFNVGSFASTPTLFVTLNGTTSAYSYACDGSLQTARSSASAAGFPFIPTAAASAFTLTGEMVINQCNKAVPKSLDGTSSWTATYFSVIKGSWVNTNTVTSLTITSSVAFPAGNTGTFYLYGGN